jgi:hypothetical protein
LISDVPKAARAGASRSALSMRQCAASRCPGTVESDEPVASAMPRKLKPCRPRSSSNAICFSVQTAIAKACKAEGITLFSPHDLRHRRISLLHLRGVP